MKKQIITLGVVLIFVFIVFSGCNTQMKQEKNIVMIQGLLLSFPVETDTCYFVIVKNFTYEGYIKMWENITDAEYEHFINSSYFITINGTLLLNCITGNPHDAILNGIFKMFDDVKINGILGTIEDPNNPGKISKSIDLVSIEMVKDNNPNLEFLIKEFFYEDPDDIPQSGIYQTDWIDNTTLKIKAYARIACINDDDEVSGGLEINDEILILRYYVKQSDTPIYCHWVADMTYNISNIAKKDYNIEFVKDYYPK